MANINPQGIDLTTGQSRLVTSSDTITDTDGAQISGVQGATGVQGTSGGNALGALIQVGSGNVAVPGNSVTSPGGYLQVSLTGSQSGSGSGSITFNTTVFSWSFGAVSGAWSADLKIFFRTAGSMNYAANLGNAGDTVTPTITSIIGAGDHSLGWSGSNNLSLSMTGGTVSMYVYAHK